MRILLTGGTGQLGQTILHQFSNCDLYAPARDSLDLTSQESVKSTFSTFRPDVIINTAAWTDVPLAEQQSASTLQANLNAVENLAQAGAQSGARFIQISTDFVFDGFTTIPYEEDSKKNPLSVYGKSKSQAEDYLLSEYPERSYILRTSWLYSRYRKNFVKTILRKLIMQSEKIEVVSDQFGCPTLAKDLANAVEIFSKKSFEPGIYHFANSGVTSWHLFAKTIAQFTDLNPERVVPVATEPSKALVTRPTFSALSTRKYSLVTGELPPAWQESLLGELSRIRNQVESELKE